MENLRIDFSPSTGSQEAWNVAYARLSDYFRALRIHSRLHRTYLVLETLRRAAVTHAKHPEMTPTAVAIHEARRMQRDWLRRIIGDLNIQESRLDASGRLAFLLCDGPDEYPDFFLNDSEPPPGLLAAMRAPIEQSGPNLAISSMVPRPIDLGLLPDLAEETTGFISRHPWLRYLLVLLVTILVLWAIYQVTQ